MQIQVGGTKRTVHRIREVEQETSPCVVIAQSASVYKGPTKAICFDDDRLLGATPAAGSVTYNVLTPEIVSSFPLGRLLEIPPRKQFEQDITGEGER